jgi:predicted nuclease of predicted toxin-antitoxin system
VLRWLADECIDAALVLQMRQSGHDVLYAAEMASGASDPMILGHARTELRLLLTEDKDFGDLVFRSGQAVPGIVLLRIEPQQAQIKWPRLAAAIAHFGEALRGRYVVVEPARFRSRPLANPL